MRPILTVLLAALGALTLPCGTAAQEQLVPVTGIITDDAGAPLANARVTLSPTRRGATTDAAGFFRFRGVPAGHYHLDVSLIGYAPAHVEITVPASGDAISTQVSLAPSPLALEGVLVTATPGAADPLTVSQSTTQLSGREFDRRLGATVADMLSDEPGVASRYAGTATSVPVIRGLTGERVVMLENGQRTGDLAGSGADHVLSIDPLSATRIEVVRGPASLLYGSGAIGGVVNVIGTDVPTNVPQRVEGFAAAQGVSATPGGAASAQVVAPLSEVLVLSARGAIRDLGDVRVGGGETLGNSSFRNRSGTVGLGFVDGRVNAGAAVAAHRFDYGVPFGHAHAEDEDEHDEDEHDEDDHEHDLDDDGHEGVDLRGHRYEVKLHGGWNPRGRAIRSVDFAATGQWYEHDEIEESGEIGTTFRLRTQTANLRADTDLGRLRGTVGLSGLLKRYEPTGEEALTPFASSGNLGLFVFQEMPILPGEHDTEHVPHLQVGGRFDHYDISTEASPGFGAARDRTFRAFSGSIGVNFPLPQGISLGASLSRAFRAPSVEELYSNALHVAAGSFDVGNPDLDPEVNLGLEALLRAQTRTVTALVSTYYNHIDDYITPGVVGDTVLVDAAGEFVVPLSRFTQGDASLVGVEGKVEVLTGRHLVLGARGDHVRGRFSGGEPLPYMPAARLGGEVRWDDGTFSGGAEAMHAFAQGEVPELEYATGSYTLLNAGVGYARRSRGLVHTVTLRGENLADVIYREATSRIKALAPNPGRNVSLVYRVMF